MTDNSKIVQIFEIASKSAGLPITLATGMDQVKVKLSPLSDLDLVLRQYSGTISSAEEISGFSRGEIILADSIGVQARRAMEKKGISYLTQDGYLYLCGQLNGKIASREVDTPLLSGNGNELFENETELKVGLGLLLMNGECKGSIKALASRSGVSVEAAELWKKKLERLGKLKEAGAKAWGIVDFGKLRSCWIQSVRNLNGIPDWLSAELFQRLCWDDQYDGRPPQS